MWTPAIHKHTGGNYISIPLPVSSTHTHICSLFHPSAPRLSCLFAHNKKSMAFFHLISWLIYCFTACMCVCVHLCVWQTALCVIQILLHKHISQEDAGICKYWSMEGGRRLAAHEPLEVSECQKRHLECFIERGYQNKSHFHSNIFKSTCSATLLISVIRWMHFKGVKWLAKALKIWLKCYFLLIVPCFIKTI